MALIDFESPPWPARVGTTLCDVGGPGNTFPDPGAGVDFIIAEGSMRVVSQGGNRYLYFTPADCPGTGHAPHPATAVIRFSTGYENVKFLLACDVPGPVIVWFYEGINRTGLVETRTIPAPSNAFFPVEYSRHCWPIREVVIRSNNSENSLDNLEFKQLPSIVVVSRLYCLIVRAGIRIPRILRPPFHTIFRD
jgi:hypothetical protein